ncbi:MAG TPA: MFS transporter [Hypericibacter adhaerens]|uniref:MFS transporter n=1 Tax=Hypericibacter adhaerens TaxID=2602016 RepID=A0A5J6MWZ0_9PROT|nr:MFS transporter [Hypericibacter adhaerens]QEX21684.1 MFS transporter [Hypericibacter adhaerens]HWA43275.1 MFS transporter [Hypericibacter adhaerens]
MEPAGAAADPYAGEGWREILGQGRWAPFLLICFGIWLHAADGLIVVTTIPAIVADIGGLAWTGWTFALYQVASIVAASLGGLAALRFGIGRATAGASAVFTIGCALDALAPDMGLFLIGRLVQGLGGGVMVALFHVAVTRAFPERHWTRIFAWVSAVWGVSALVGPLIGGLFAEAGLWRDAYWAFAAQALLVTICSPFLFSNVAGAPQGLELRVPWRALAALVPGVLGIAVASVVDSAGLAVLSVAVGAGFLALFFYFDRREHSPLLPERSLSEVPVRFGLLMVLCFAVATISFSVYGPLLLAQLHHVSLILAGYLIAIESVAWSVTAMMVGWVRPKGEPLCIKLGASVIALGLLGFALSVPHGPIWAIALSAALQGGGFGLAWAFIARRVAAGAIAAERERAAGALPTTQMLSYAIGAALAAIIANSLGLELATPPDRLQTIGFWIFFAFLPLTLPGFRAAWRLAR